MPNDNSPSKKRYYDIAVVVPLEEEVVQFCQVFEQLDDLSTDRLLRCSVSSGESSVSIILVKQEDMGKSKAREAAQSVIADFDVGLIVCLGIAGSLSSDLKLGDVCCSGKVFDVIDNAKASDRDSSLNVEFSPSIYQTDRALLAAFSFVRLKKELRTLYLDWQATQGKEAEALLPGPVEGRKGRDEQLNCPEATEGAVACGFVSKSDEYNERLRRIDRKLLAIETESGGIFEVAQLHSVPAIAIRGISDHADAQKK